MSDKHYDVVILGRSIGAMALAALLARRDFSVLVVGNGARGADYQFRDITLRRRVFTPLAATSPAFKRIFAELAQSQVFRRRLAHLDPMLSIILPDRRFELPPDLVIFQQEIDREFPEVRRVIDDLYADLTRVNAAADLAFEQDVCWPPGTFWERRETNAAAAGLPYQRASDRALLGDFPPNHPYVDIVMQSAAFGAHLAPGSRLLPAFALARLHGAWTRGPLGVSAGEDEVVNFLAERITALGGQVMFGERAVGLDATHRDTHQILIDGVNAVVGATFLVTDEPGESIAHLARGQGLERKAQREWPLVTQKAGRFTTSIVVRREALPEPLGAETIIFPRMPGASPDPASPVVHLQRTDRIVAEDDEPDQSDTSLLVAEILLPTPGTLPLTDARDVVLNIVLSQLPFLEQHLVVVDSPHDGLPVWSYSNGKRTSVDRLEARGSTRAAEPMAPLLSVEPAGYLGFGGEPLRGPIQRTLLTGRSVLPSLGQEGELLAAWSVARIITRSDRRRSRMRRDMWSRIEFG